MVYESFTLTEFKDLGLSEAILRAVEREGYTTPTPIQAQAIPVLLTGRDLVGLAQTGTGKTAAFTLPILQMIVGMKGLPKPKTCRALIVAPTRELAAQIVESVKTYSRFTQVSVTMVVGGVRPGPQIKALARGVDVLVATPGRLLDHMSTGAVSIHDAQIVVLDEADQMMDLGFVPAIRKIMKAMPANRQTMLFSATMPKEIRSLAADFLTDPEEIKASSVGKPVEKINQRVIHVAGSDKRDVLVRLMQADDVGQAIVFTRTKRGADKVCEHLEKQGMSAGALHGNKSQGQRDRTLGGFRNGRLKILVATDIAARGIDVDDVSHIINFELPHVPETYVHRIGRTARAGKGGIAIALCDRSETGLLRDIEKLIKADIPAEGEVPSGPLQRPPQRQANQRPRPSGPDGRSGQGAGKPRRDSAPWRDGPAKEGRPQGARPERPRYEGTRTDGARADGDRPQGARPEGGRPQGARPHSGKPGGRPQGARPQGARPQGPNGKPAGNGQRRRRPQQQGAAAN